MTVILMEGKKNQKQKKKGRKRGRVGGREEILYPGLSLEEEGEKFFSQPADFSTGALGQCEEV